MTTFRADFGGERRPFRLTLPMIVELERLTGAGIGELFGRLVDRRFRMADMRETIRLALIGGGTDPSEAAALVEAYVDPRPLSESYALAVGILDALFTGEAADEAPAPAPVSRSDQAPGPALDPTPADPDEAPAA